MAVTTKAAHIHALIAVLAAERLPASTGYRGGVTQKLPREDGAGKAKGRRSALS
ncbi:MAG: hypothetical protein ACTHNH_21615 [Mesorhizobium sp.]